MKKVLAILLCMALVFSFVGNAYIPVTAAEEGIEEEIQAPDKLSDEKADETDSETDSEDASETATEEVSEAATEEVSEAATEGTDEGKADSLLSPRETSISIQTIIIAENLLNQTTAFGTPEDQLTLPTTLSAKTADGQQVSIEGISWNGKYDAFKPEVYSFTPLLPDGYTLAEDAVLPSIQVTVAAPATAAKALTNKRSSETPDLNLHATSNGYMPVEAFAEYGISFVRLDSNVLALRFNVSLHDDYLEQTLGAAIAAGSVDDPGRHQNYDEYLNTLDGAAVGLPPISFTARFDKAAVVLPETRHGDIMNGEEKLGTYLWADEDTYITFTGTFLPCLYNRTNVQLRQSIILNCRTSHHDDSEVALSYNDNNQCIEITFTDPPAEVTDPDSNYKVVKTSPKKTDHTFIDFMIDLSATGELSKLDGKVLKDSLPEGLEIEKAEIAFNQTSETVSETDYSSITVDPAALKLEYTFPDQMPPDQPVKEAVVRLRARLNKDTAIAYMANGINQKFTNTAGLYRDESAATAMAQDTAETSVETSFFSKNGAPLADNSREYEWTITVNSHGTNVGSAYIIDSLDQDEHEYITNSDVVLLNRVTGTERTLTMSPLTFSGTAPTFEELNNASLKDPKPGYTSIIEGLPTGQCGYYSYEDDTGSNRMVLVIPFKEYVGEDIEVIYRTSISKEPGDPNAPTEVSNTAKMIWSHLRYGDGPEIDDEFDFSMSKNEKIDYRWVTKSGGGYNANTQLLTWNFEVNKYRSNLDDITITDIFEDNKQIPDGLGPQTPLVLSDGQSTREVAYSAAEIDSDHYRLESDSDPANPKTKLTIYLKGGLDGKYYTFSLNTRLVDGEILSKNTKQQVSNTATVLADGGVKEQTVPAKATQTVQNVLLKKSNTMNGTRTNYNYTDRSVGWTLTVNPNTVPIEGAVIADQLPPGTTLLNLTKIVRKNSGGAVIEEIAPDAGFSSLITNSPDPLLGTVSQQIAFRDGLKVTVDVTAKETADGYLANQMTLTYDRQITDSFEFQYTTAFTDDAYRLDHFSQTQTIITNTGYFTGGTVYDEPIKKENTTVTAQNNRILAALTKSGAFFRVTDANQNVYGEDKAGAAGIEWTVAVNRNQAQMAGFTVKDNLLPFYDLDQESFQIHTATLSARGDVAHKNSDITAECNPTFTSSGWQFDIPAAYNKDVLVVTFYTYLAENTSKGDMKNSVQLYNGEQLHEDTGNITAAGAEDFSADDYFIAAKAPYVKVEKFSSNKNGESYMISLADAEYTLRKAQNDGQPIADGSEKTRFTNERGDTTFIFLKKDTLYRIEETTSPTGYVLDENVYYVYFQEAIPFDNTHNLTNLTLVDLSVSNFHSYDMENKPQGIIEFSKATEDGIALADISFELSKPGAADFSRTALSDESGVVRFENLDAGTYEIEEKPLAADFPYELWTTKWSAEVTLDDSGNYSFTLSGGDEGSLSGDPAEGYTIINKYSLGDVSLIKVDAASGDPVSGAQFAIYDAATDQKAAYLIEDANTPGTYVVSNVDRDGENPLNAKDSRGADYIMQGKLIYGNYYFVETHTPDGYFPDYVADDITSTDLAKHDFAVDSTDPLLLSNTSVGTTFENTPAAFSVSGSVTDPDNTGLSGATMGLFPSGTTDFTPDNVFRGMHSISDSDGKFTFPGLPEGSYILAQIQEPDGYQKTTTQPIDITITSDTDPNSLLGFIFINQKKEDVIPPDPTPKPDDPTPDPTPKPDDPTPKPDDPTPGPSDPTPDDPAPEPNDPNPDDPDAGDPGAENPRDGNGSTVGRRKNTTTRYSSRPTGSYQRTRAVKTGDMSATDYWIFLAVMMAVIIVFAARKKRAAKNN